MICDQQAKAAALLENKEKGTTPTLSCLVLFDGFTQAFAARAKACKVEVVQLEQLMVSGLLRAALCKLSSVSLPLVRLSGAGPAEPQRSCGESQSQLTLTSV